jgi:tripartite-type tricarboxylate transporter receptor subunit TctC
LLFVFLSKSYLKINFKREEKMRNFRNIAYGFVLFFSVMAIFNVNAADFPNKPLELVVPFGAGGGTDVNARTMVARIAHHINNQPVIVVNKTGGGTVIGSRYVLDGRNDGYTLFLASPSAIMLAPMIHKTEFTWRNFVGINQVAEGNDGLYVKADSPFKTLKELITYAKENPGKIKYVTPGAGSINHLEGQGMCVAEGIDIRPIHTKSDAECLTAILGGHVQVAIATLGAFQTHVEAGTLRCLGQFPQQREKAFPNLPTIKEQGVNVYFDCWRWLLVPKGVPADRIKILAGAFRKVLLEDKETIAALDKIKNPVLYRPPEDYEGIMIKDEENIRGMIKAANL